METLTYTSLPGTRQQILQHIRDHLYDPIPLFDMSFNDIISGGIQSESVATLGQPDTLYTSVGHYLNLMSNANAYATHIEITAANHLFNIDTNVTFSGTSYPSTHPEPNSCNVLYDPSLSTTTHSSTTVKCKAPRCLRQMFVAFLSALAPLP